MFTATCWWTLYGNSIVWSCGASLPLLALAASCTLRVLRAPSSRRLALGHYWARAGSVDAARSSAPDSNSRLVRARGTFHQGLQGGIAQRGRCPRPREHPVHDRCVQQHADLEHRVGGELRGFTCSEAELAREPRLTCYSGSEPHLCCIEDRPRTGVGGGGGGATAAAAAAVGKGPKCLAAVLAAASQSEQHEGFGGFLAWPFLCTEASL